MNGITELAELFKNRENRADYSPMFGEIISLPNIDIKLGDRIHLDGDNVKFTFDILKKIYHDEREVYEYLNKTVVLLPYSNNQKFIAIGVIV